MTVKMLLSYSINTGQKETLIPLLNSLLRRKRWTLLLSTEYSAVSLEEIETLWQLGVFKEYSVILTTSFYGMNQKI